MKHVVIYIPGLGDQNNAIGRKVITTAWRLYGVRPIVYPMDWSRGKLFQPKLERLLERIDALAEIGCRISLVGESAGASAAIHAFAARPDVIHRTACICGKLRGRVQSYPAFSQSMDRLPHSLDKLDMAQRTRILSVHPLHDSVVPIADTIIPGAESSAIPTSGHAWSIVLGTTLFSGRLLHFIKRPVEP